MYFVKDERHNSVITLEAMCSLEQFVRLHSHLSIELVVQDLGLFQKCTLGQYVGQCCNPADKVTASSLHVIIAASGRAPTDVPQLCMNTAVFKLSILAVESQKTSSALSVTISWTLAMRGVTRAKRKAWHQSFWSLV